MELKHQILNVIWMSGPLHDSKRVSTIGYCVGIKEDKFILTNEVILEDIETKRPPQYEKSSLIEIYKQDIIEVFKLDAVKKYIQQ